MGRYTTVQTYTDTDNKVASISYDNATGYKDKEGEKAGSKNSEKFTFNKVENVSGSSAGAGSGEFHMYRASRKREMERIEKMQMEHDKRISQNEFDEIRERNRLESESKTNKKAEKRRKKKQKMKELTKKIKTEDANKEQASGNTKQQQQQTPENKQVARKRDERDEQ